MWLVLEKKAVTHSKWKDFHREGRRGHPGAHLRLLLRETDGRVRVAPEGRVDGRDLHVRECVMLAV